MEMKDAKEVETMEDTIDGLPQQLTFLGMSASMSNLAFLGPTASPIDFSKVNSR